ncbi:MAG: Coenzyme F420 hydrogenase/dehydrogenase, beta subunit C-terminal domain, partial [Clostridia bacterium]|nr:Coenzyme F420 hydrogenase/dehydrogenase, beta subunit C-terminal domain [Clostridia bacterium]
LGKDYEDLLLIDLICHGVGSPKVFKTCISELQKDFGKEIESYEFRAKRETFEVEYLSKITFKDKKTEYIGEDRYTQLFLSQKCLRPSCGENCTYRKEIRQGDITIADFKGLLFVFPHLKGTKRNYSSVIINTKKGEKVIDILSKNMELIPCEIDDIKKFNPLFYRQTKPYDGRNEFFEFYCDFPEKTVNEKTLPSKVVKRSVKRKIFDKLPEFLRKKLIDIRVPRS